MTGPQPGDIGILPTGLGDAKRLDRIEARLIQWGCDAPVNHTFIWMGDGELVEAAPGGARRVTLASHTDWDPARITWSGPHLPLSPTERTIITRYAQAFAERHVGYGYADIVAIGLAQAKLGRRINPHAPLREQPWWVRRIQDWDTMICSQLVDACYTVAGVHLFGDGRLPGLVSPGDIYWRVTTGVGA